MNIVLMVVIGAIVEIAVWIGVAQFISGWYVFFWFIFAALVGFKLLRSSTSTIMPQLKQMQMTGQMSLNTNVSHKIAMAIAGILFIIPGLISDLIALLILLPPVQKMMVAGLMSAMAKRQQAMMEKMMGGAGGANPFEDLMRQMQGQEKPSRTKNGSQIIDGEAKEVNPDTKKINMKDIN